MLGSYSEPLKGIKEKLLEQKWEVKLNGRVRSSKSTVTKYGILWRRVKFADGATALSASL